MGVNSGNVRATRRRGENQKRVLRGTGRRGAGSAAAEATERGRINPDIFVEGLDACLGGRGGVWGQLEEREKGSPGACEEGQGKVPVRVEWHFKRGEALVSPCRWSEHGWCRGKEAK